MNALRFFKREYYANLVCPTRYHVCRFDDCLDRIT